MGCTRIRDLKWGFLFLTTLSIVVYLYTFHPSSLFLSRPQGYSLPSNETPGSTSKQRIIPLKFRPLPLGRIQAAGWLQAELQAQADGLAGHEYDFYDYIVRSPWLGGTEEYAVLNEGLPYWFNGLVYLAYGLDDDRLKAQVHDVADYVVTHQQRDGWIGPERPRLRSFWGRYPFLLGLIGLAEANTTWTSRITNSMHSYIVLMNTMLKNNGTGYRWNEGDELTPKHFAWGRIRSADMVIVLIWLMENDSRGQETLLMENMKMLDDMGIKWEDWFNGKTYMEAESLRIPHKADLESPAYMYTHGVNVAQGLKAAAVYYRLRQDESLLQTAHDGVDWTFKFHGAASGTIIADDVTDHPWPYAGAELCTVVEAMYSLTCLYQALGTNSFADRVERAAFNALPGMATSDWWAHQYMTQANQPFSRELKQSPFFNTDEVGQTFGLEPNFPCCTLNHPQGLSKYLAASYVSVGDDGIAHALLGPAKVDTRLRTGQVSIDCTTSYPFSDELHYSIRSSAPFDFYVRIPEWSPPTDTVVSSANGEVGEAEKITGLIKIALPEGDSEVDVVLKPSMRIEERANDTVSITRGALLYALEIGANVTSQPPRAYKTKEQFPVGYAPDQVRDYTMTNTTPWNMAIDTSTLRFHYKSSSPFPNPIFAPGAPPVWITARACEIEWPLFRESVPDVPIPLTQRECIKEPVEVTLRTYGSEKLHMAELPIINL